MPSSEQESYAQNKERVAELEQRKARIRELNDQLRTWRTGGRFMITSGVQDLGDVALLEILLEVGGFDDFNADSDPHDEHDFGAVSYGGEKIFWKIDYYDKAFEHGSPDPADSAVTARVITIMLASEY